MTKLQIKQIGNGGAFNFKETNSSFLIKSDKTTMLFDCGHNVYHKLRALHELNEFNLKDLKAVYISHFDDDHIGSLKTLIYYQYFVNNVILDIIIDEQLNDEMQYFLRDLDGYNSDFIKIKDTLYNIVLLTKDDITQYNDLELLTFECEHHIPCFGLIIHSEEAKRYIIISGDTKAIPHLDEEILMLKESENELDKNCEFLVFHDFSNWDCPEKQVHMCKSDMEQNYKSEFIEMLNFYHNDDLNYNKDWR